LAAAGARLVAVDKLDEADAADDAAAVADDASGEARGAAADPLAAPAGAALLPGHLIYACYTSGSTGRPKGGAMAHAALAALLDWQERPSHAGDRTLQFTSLAFDVSFQELFDTWSRGGTLVLVSEETRRDPAALARVMAGEQVTRLFLPFVALQQL